jgi:hypothetical protein
MTKPKVKEVNAQTGEEIIRDATAQEIALYEAEQAFEATKQAEAEAKAASRQAILDRLGLTAEEAQLLLGGN